MISGLLLALTLALAFANGANDVSKGIATLVGSGVAEYRKAVWWGALWTVIGGLAAALASEGLVAAFSGDGLLRRTSDGHGFLVAVAGGALLWVLFASATGFPVSTTHAITGALCGAGIMAAGAGGVQWGAVVSKFALPLLLSPLLSLALTFFLSPAIHYSFGRLRNYCVCIEEGRGVCLRPEGGASAAVAVAAAAAPGLIVGELEDCASRPLVAARVNIRDGLHWVAAGLTSFARGMNDTPKILALGTAAATVAGLDQPRLYMLVAAAMGLGSLLWGFRVTETLAEKVTPMSHEQGFSANLISSALVGLASQLALPVSTTHVASGAIIGVGLRQGGRNIRWRTVRDMLLAWFVTLPVSGLLALGCYAAISRL